MADKTVRRFLEPPSSGVDSFVKVTVERGNYANVLLKIADCDRRVELWLYKSNGREAMLKKLDHLQFAIDTARAEVETW
jgi:hypothetical protein